MAWWELVGTVSSSMEILVSEISTRSGLAVLVLMSVRMAAGGKSLALRPGRLTKSLLEGGISSRMQLRTELWCYVKWPWLSASWHPFRMCAVVGLGELHKGHVEDTLYLQRRRLRRVGRQSYLRQNEENLLARCTCTCTASFSRPNFCERMICNSMGVT